MSIKLDRNAFTKQLVNKNKLTPHLDKFIGKGDFEWDANFTIKRADDAFHPSSDCLPSLNELYHKATGTWVPREPSISLRKAFVVGHFWHRYIQEIILRLQLADKDSIERIGTKRWGDGPFHWATGAGDIAPCEVPGHGKWLVDIKTMQAHDFKQKNLPSWCAHKYIAQANIYMDWFDLDRALILCVQKDSPHDLKEIIVEKNQPLVDAIYKKWTIVGECLTQKIEPPVDEPFELPL